MRNEATKDESEETWSGVDDGSNIPMILFGSINFEDYRVLRAPLITHAPQNLYSGLFIENG